jgi:hypothetical protein
LASPNAFDVFFDGASGLLHPSRDPILVHLQFLPAIAEFAFEQGNSIGGSKKYRPD